jgi:phage repressor protein C with HTH and peptisase S24 domain
MDKISPIKERILQFIDSQNIKKIDFCELTGISYANLKGKSLYSEIGGDKIAEILSIYPYLNPEWLLTGKGEMLKKREKIPVATQAKNGEGIPLIPIDAMAGFAAGEMQVLEYECERYVVPVFREAEFLIQVKGSSMYPKYSSGDIVACKNVPLNDIFFQWNKVYVVDTNQGALIKRIRKGKDEEHILLVSENEKYEPFELKISQLHAIAIVIGVIRLE